MNKAFQNTMIIVARAYTHRSSLKLNKKIGEIVSYGRECSFDVTGGIYVVSYQLNIRRLCLVIR